MKLAIIAALSGLVGLEAAQPAHVGRLEAAATAFSEIMQIPEQTIPQELLDRAHCVVVVPGLKKGAFIVGGRYGRGFFTCREQSGQGWRAPASVRVEGGSFGFQIGGQEIDLVMLVMNERGADRLMSSKFTLGGEASAAAGPVGRNATVQTDALLTAQILSWSRSRGVFAGVSLQGATLRQDLSTNRALYGRTLENREIIEQNLPVPGAASRFIEAINKYSSRR